MFRYAIAVVAVFIGATLIACGQPKLEVIGGETYDWGKVKPPKEGYLEAEIKMKNAGTDGLLKLVEIKPGCGCTKTDPDKTELNAGEISTMKVRLNISPTQSGPLTKSITVRHTGGADTTTTYLFLKADIQRALQLSPTVFLSFTDMRVGQEASAKIEITNNDSRPITLSDVVTDNNLIVNIGEDPAAGPEVRDRGPHRPDDEGQLHGQGHVQDEPSRSSDHGHHGLRHGHGV
jgi:hypothetical protein